MMQILKKLVLLLLFMVLGSGSVWAADFTIPVGTPQSLFEEVITEAARLTAYRSMVSAEPGGLTGFDAGISVSAVDVDSALWNYFDVDESTLVAPKLMVRKGLPFNLDVGAFYSEVSDYDISAWGAELQWAMLEGSTVSPALALRGSYTELDAAGEMEVKTTAADLVISKGFAMFTPYAGIGIVAYDGEYTGNTAGVVGTLQDYDDDEARYFAGLQFALALMRITAEYEQMDDPVYSLKLSLGF